MVCQKIRRRRQHHQQNHDRVVWASRKNIVITGVPDRGRRYLSDFYTTLIDIQWRWTLLFFVVGFVLTWVVFAVYYYLLCFLHGDLDPVHKGSNSSWTPCVDNVNSFTEAYLFSIETMSTIGYGSRQQTEECPGVYLAVMVQSVIGAGLQFALASLVVSKTRRANRISQTILFSNTAVIYLEDSLLKLAVRIGDMRKGDVIGAHATGMLIKKTLGKAGQKVPVRMFTVPFEAEGGKQKLFLCWPCLLIHTVDQHSPFWTLSRDDLLQEMYELIVILDGVAATTSKPFQARKSYHCWEILWGRRFKALTITQDDFNSSGYVVNYTSFHLSFPVPTPFCSAQVLERTRLLRELNAEFQDVDPDALEMLGKDGSFCRCRRNCEHADDRACFQFENESYDNHLEESDSELQSQEDIQAKPRISPAANLKRRQPQTGTTESEQVELEAADSNKTETEDSDQTEQTDLDSSQVKSSTPKKTNPQPEAAKADEKSSNTSTPAKDRVRKISRVEFQPLPFLKGTASERKLSLGDAVNMYRHRRSVTDTYLGTELPDEEHDDSEAHAAILSLVSQHNRCPDGRPDVKDVSRLRKKSTTLPLMFATGAGDDPEAHSS